MARKRWGAVKIIRNGFLGYSERQHEQFFLVSIFCLTAQEVAAQSGAVQLRIDIEKTVNYYQDVTDYSRLAVDAAPRPVASSRNFSTGVSIADIVAVNGEPVRGTAFGQGATLITRPNPMPGQALADVFAGGLIEWIFDIQSATDRTVDEMGRPNSIGTILFEAWPEMPGPPESPWSVAAISALWEGPAHSLEREVRQRLPRLRLPHDPRRLPKIRRTGVPLTAARSACG